MRAISARAGELVRTLQQSASLLERLTRRTLDPAILAELEALGDVNALPHLVALALSAGSESRTRVASVAVATWRRASSASLISLDESYRVTWWTPGTDSAPWDRLRPADVADLARVDEDAWALLAVASFHASGHVREAAVRALDTIATGNELPFLIVRLNDWVDVVAERARDAVMRRVDATQANVWARNVPLIQRLAATSRRDHSDVIDAVYNVLRRPSSREALETLFASDDQAARRTAFRLAREGATGHERVTLVRRALRERDIVIRFDAVRDACESFDDASLAPVLDEAMADPFMPVRRRALLASIDRFPEVAGTRARFALLDHNPAVRELGRWALIQNEPTLDIAQFYRAQLAEGETVGAIGGLGETGQSSDVALVARFVTDARVRVRREAIRTVARLDATGNASTIIAALNDRSAKVVRAAREAVEANPNLIDGETVRSIITTSPYAHSRIQALRLSNVLGKWASLEIMLETARTFDPEVGAEVREQVHHWLATANARSTAPTSAQLASIRELLGVANQWIDERTREWLRGFLTPWLPTDRGD